MTDGAIGFEGVVLCGIHTSWGDDGGRGGFGGHDGCLVDSDT